MNRYKALVRSITEDSSPVWFPHGRMQLQAVVSEFGEIAHNFLCIIAFVLTTNAVRYLILNFHHFVIAGKYAMREMSNQLACVLVQITCVSIFTHFKSYLAATRHKLKWVDI